MLNRFVELLDASTHVDIAVAWVGPGLAVEHVLELAVNKEIRIVVGLSGNSTDPPTLRRLLEQVDLRVAPAPLGGIFHPKFYRFGGPDGTVCWIGSANFTRRGFGSNVELVHEFADTDGDGGAWFQKLWQGLDEDPLPAIAHYEEHYKPPRPGGYGGGGQHWPHELPGLHDLETWDDFVAALHVLDDYCHHRDFGWDVLGDTHSYLHTIGVGREVARRENWDDFSVRDRNILLGLGHLDDTGEWGLLGNMKGAAKVVGVFTPPVDHEKLNHVLEQVGVVVDSEDTDIAEAAEGAVEGIMELPRFGPAVATRIVTLARPDRLVSVNSESAAGLGEFSGLRQEERYLAENYSALLRFIYAQPWFNVAEPENAAEWEIWRCRAALLDAFVYIPNH